MKQLKSFNKYVKSINENKNIDLLDEIVALVLNGNTEDAFRRGDKKRAWENAGKALSKYSQLDLNNLSNEQKSIIKEMYLKILSEFVGKGPDIGGFFRISKPKRKQRIVELSKKLLDWNMIDNADSYETYLKDYGTRMDEIDDSKLGKEKPFKHLLSKNDQ